MSLSDRNCHSLVVLPKLFENSWPLSAHIHLDQSESSTTEVAGILASCPLRALVSEGTIVLYHLKSPCQAYGDVIKLSIFYDIATLCSHADPAVISITNIPQGTWYQRLNFRLGLWYWDTVETWRSRAYGMKISGDVIKEGCGSLCLYHLPFWLPDYGVNSFALPNPFTMICRLGTGQGNPQNYEPKSNFLYKLIILGIHYSLKKKIIPFPALPLPGTFLESFFLQIASYLTFTLPLHLWLHVTSCFDKDCSVCYIKSIIFNISIHFPLFL